MFFNRLTKVYKHLGKQAARQGISCYRVYDHDLPEFPFCIEFYGERLYLAEYRRRHGMDEDQHDEWLYTCLPVISTVLGVPVDEIYWRQRERKAGRQGQYTRQSEEGEFFTVPEGGLSFLVNLTDYLDTGLFLDHRLTRARVREEAAGKDVLNLFAYTGSFSVYAAAGGARSVTTVDLSKTYLGWAERNMQLNGLQDPRRTYIHADVKQYLGTLPGEAFDLVVMDPPTFSNSKRMKDFLDIQRDHVPLLNEVLRAVRPGGAVYFSTNFTRFVLDREAIAAAGVKDITRATTPFDFEGKLKRWCYLLQK
ncbi:23S rRNA (cytosine1962-C5)-methyltransferase [Dinghuibacter silviterrae]|uniref:23S rRNA (Cytosine1962-C5)-methyltransferase n=2 Tax=Dinghuibacter silviterrae TaxID=1539049 RepID=A0A4R8DSC4_9BACT|nr:23S rRNA (cytosine1962-C5)-methyltransferase [Dinghuibacter silviterrae]